MPVKPRLFIPEAHLPLFVDPDVQAKRYKIMFGGAGSGKSETEARYIIGKVRAISGYNAAAVRKTYAECLTSVFPLLEKTIHKLGVSAEFKITRSPAKILHIPTENEIVFGGMKDEGEQEKFKGMTFRRGNLEGVLLDEVSRLTEDDFKIIDDRVRGETGIQKEIVMAFNPITVDHWLKTRFKIEIENGKAVTGHPDAWVLRTNVDDNPWADKKYIAILDGYKDTDPYHYEVYRCGNWGSLGENNVVVPYPLIYKAKQNRIDTPCGQFSIGVDPAREGDDEAVIYIRQGLKFLEQMVYPKSDGPMLADGVQYLVDKWRGKNGGASVYCQIDITGVGTSCADTLRRRGILDFYASEISFGGNAVDSDKYANTVTEMYFNARDMLPSVELLPGDESMFTELTRRRFHVEEKKSRYQIEDKKAFKKRIGKSPDRADAFVLCLYPPRATTIAPDVYGDYGGGIHKEF